jgi:rhodanese-related sulfurtransferase
MGEDEFVAVVTEGQPVAPAYFLYNATLNKQDRDVRDLGTQPAALDDNGVARALAASAVVLDTRPAIEFAAGHLRGAVSVPADGRMAETAGMVLRPDQPLVLMAPDGYEVEAATRLARIGFDAVVGYVPDVEGYLLRHADEVTPASRLTVAQADDALAQQVQFVDIRNVGEISAGMIPGARHIPLPELPARVDELDPAAPVVLYCAGGWRSSVGASLLRANGFQDVSDLLGGYGAWASAHRTAS